jgi:mannose-6-phosphate isomerase-like protein (cupin superfamily)
LKYIKIYADENGESHFTDHVVLFDTVDFAPPAPPIRLSEFQDAGRYAFTVFPSGWFGDWHPTPTRQIFFFFKGELEVTVSDGEIRYIGPGDIVLVEDTTGKGHITHVVSDVDVHSAVVQLPDKN